MTQKLRVGVIGGGVFGTYHARKVAASKQAVLVGVYDRDAGRASGVIDDVSVQEGQATDARVYATETELVSVCDALIIATPAHSHFDLGRAGLRAGKHVLIEKPLALSGEEADALVALAREQDLVLQVGHQERLVCDALGLFEHSIDVQKLELVRAGPPPKGGRAMDVSVIWDLMIHDIDLAHCLLGATAHGFSATGVRELGDEFDQVDASFMIEDTHVELSASRLAELFERTMKIRCADGMIEVDFVNRTLKNTTGYQLNDAFASEVPDPLGAADEHFFAACVRGTESEISGQSAKFAVATAEKLETLAKSIKGKR
ncbi:MAG: Gfo/Idh/MocA family oxidoreductase [Hyphomonadaceae bacterium]